LSAVIEKADAIYSQEKIPYEEEFALLSQAAVDFPDSSEIAWRLARSHYHLATEVYGADDAKKKEYLEKGLELAQAVCATGSHFLCVPIISHVFVQVLV